MAHPDIYRDICSVIREGGKAAVASIVEAKGSTPAGARSKMLIREDGSISGTVGGGLVEALVIEDSLKVIKSSGTLMKTYRMSYDDINSGMICGGSIDVMIEKIRPEDLTEFEKIIQFSENGIDCTVLTLFKDGVSTGKYVLGPDVNSNSLLPYLKNYNIPEKTIEESLLAGKPTYLNLETGDILIEHQEGLKKLIIFGGGHISLALSDFAKKSGFYICVVDDRKEFISAERFPGADELICADIVEAFSKLDINKSTFIVIVTRGHALDEQVLEKSVATEAGFISMIGSGKKVKIVFDHLLDRGVPKEKLRRVSAPVGLDIGAHTVEEIAVSIVAELIKVRRYGNTSAVRHLKDKVSGYF